MEVTKRELQDIMTKIIAILKKDWVVKLLEVLWAYNFTWKSTIGFSPYELVYGKNPILPIEYERETLRTTSTVGMKLFEA